MAGNTITRAQLGEAVYQEVGLSRNESGDLVEAVLQEISDALIRGETVKVSSFGSFSVRQKGRRIGRNPKTGEEVPILPRKVLVFRASHVLKSLIDSALSAGGGEGAGQASENEAGAAAPAMGGSVGGVGDERGGGGHF